MCAVRSYAGVAEPERAEALAEVPEAVAPLPELVRARPPDRNPALVYLAGLGSDRSRAAMLGRLKGVARIVLARGDVTPEETLGLPWQALRYQHLHRIRAELVASGLAPSTINLALAAVRGVAREAFNLELISAEDYQRIRQVRNVRGERVPAGRALAPGELAAVMEACARDPGPAGARDAAMVGLMYICGLRRQEVPALTVSSYSPAGGQLRALGKGNKERLVYVSGGAAEALADWLAVRGTEEGALFVPINKGGRLSLRPMSAVAVYEAVRKRRKQAGVARFTPHDLRRTFIGDLLEAGVDISTVQRLAGHANVETTVRYDRRPEEAKRKAVGLLHLPYRGRGPMP